MGGRLLMDVTGESLWTLLVNSCGHFVHENLFFGVGVNFCGHFWVNSRGHFW